MSFYTRIARPLLFRLDPEKAHHLTLNLLSSMPWLWKHVRCAAVSRPREYFGVKFPNPVGLAAGLDKNGTALMAWEALGFGFIEVGTVTAHAQPGNPQPRLFRIPENSALINRMGFNNDGAEAMARRFDAFRSKGFWPRVPVGINLGKSKITPLEEAPKDYLTSFQKLHAHGDYFVVNVSSPNTPGLRTLQDAEALKAIVRTLLDWNASKPLLVKVAPDLMEEDLRAVAALAEREGLSGIIATNTTIARDGITRHREEAGGLSGAPLREHATAVLRTLRSETKLPLIASGGVMGAAAAREKKEAGADLIQVYTGLIYRGPELVREVANAF